MTMYNIQEAQQRIKNNNGVIAACKEEMNNKRASINNLKAEVSELKEFILDKEREIAKKHNEYVNTERQVFTLTYQNKDLSLMIEEEEHRVAVEAIIAEEPTVWEALRSRLIYNHGLLDDGTTNLESHIDVDAITDKLHKIYNNPKDYSQQAVRIRAAVSHYLEVQRELTSQHCKGKVLTLDDKKLRPRVLDNLLNSQDIAQLWNK